MVGLGTQDSFTEAEEFVARYGTSFPMLWDESFTSWTHFGVNGQPAWILLTPDGEVVERWNGVLDEGEVLDLAHRHARA